MRVEASTASTTPVSVLISDLTVLVWAMAVCAIDTRTAAATDPTTNLFICPPSPALCVSFPHKSGDRQADRSRADCVTPDGLAGEAAADRRSGLRRASMDFSATVAASPIGGSTAPGADHPSGHARRLCRPRAVCGQLRMGRFIGYFARSAGLPANHRRESPTMTEGARNTVGFKAVPETPLAAASPPWPPRDLSFPSPSGRWSGWPG